jgi:transposase
MSKIYVGVDVSKGYVDLCITNTAGTPLPGGGRFDDTAAGHAAVRELLRHHTDPQFPERQLLVAVEATGGLERNWLRLFSDLTAGTTGCVYQLNPLVVRRFRQQELHKNVTDAASARDLAAYLRSGMRPQERPYEGRPAGAVAYYRAVRSAIERSAELQNELKSLLPSTHPELVQYCRQGFRQWVLQVLTRYPTSQKLARARPETLARIPYLQLDRAQSLVAAAKESVASLVDADTAEAIRFLASEIRRLDRDVQARKRQLAKRLQLEEPEAFALLTSIPGIADWTAVILLLEIGAFHRFPNADALVAFSGLDPHYEQSGDTERRGKISKRGRSQIRAILFTSAESAVVHNPTIKEFYARLRAKGKLHHVALVACMAKLLRLAYTCVLKQEPFDPEQPRRDRERYEAEAAARQALRERAAENQAGERAPARNRPVTGSLTAPVSRREATRRRAAAVPPRGQAPQVGGHSATPQSQHTRATSRRPDSEKVGSTA